MSNADSICPTSNHSAVSGSGANTKIVRSEAAYTALDRYISSDEALNAARGTIMERNAAREPWNNRIDFRLAADIRNPFADGHNLE